MRKDLIIRLNGYSDVFAVCNVLNPLFCLLKLVSLNELCLFWLDCALCSVHVPQDRFSYRMSSEDLNGMLSHQLMFNGNTLINKPSVHGLFGRREITLAKLK